MRERRMGQVPKHFRHRLSAVGVFPGLFQHQYLQWPVCRKTNLTIFQLSLLCLPSYREHTFAKVAKLVTTAEEHTFVKTVVHAAQMQQNVGLKNGCIVLCVTDTLALIPVISTKLLQTPVAWLLLYFVGHLGSHLGFDPS